MKDSRRFRATIKAVFTTDCLAGFLNILVVPIQKQLYALAWSEDDVIGFQQETLDNWANKDGYAINDISPKSCYKQYDTRYIDDNTQEISYRITQRGDDMGAFNTDASIELTLDEIIANNPIDITKVKVDTWQS
jgi:hypothetical protein